MSVTPAWNRPRARLSGTARGQTRHLLAFLACVPEETQEAAELNPILFAYKCPHYCLSRRTQPLLSFYEIPVTLASPDERGSFRPQKSDYNWNSKLILNQPHALVKRHFSILLLLRNKWRLLFKTERRWIRLLNSKASLPLADVNVDNSLHAKHL